MRPGVSFASSPRAQAQAHKQPWGILVHRENCAVVVAIARKSAMSLKGDKKATKMAQRKKISIIGLAVVMCMSLVYPAFADDYCPWGGDNGQSMLCAQCMKREWTGWRWRLVNTCPYRHFSIFIPYDPNWR